MSPVKTMFLQVGRKRYQVESFEQASEMCCTARDKWLQNGARGARPGSQLLLDEQGRVIGHVAYNGRVFPGTPQAWKSGTQALYG